MSSLNQPIVTLFLVALFTLTFVSAVTIDSGSW